MFPLILGRPGILVCFQMLMLGRRANGSSVASCTATLSDETAASLHIANAGGEQSR
jgi:hypothetical protein